MPVAVSLVTGLLGAGKSTVVQALLAHKPPGEKWAIFVNEVGAVGIDGAALSAAANADQQGGGGCGGGGEIVVKELAGGCMCCSAAGVTQAAIATLLRRSRPTRLIIEMSGLGHPGSVLDALQKPPLGDSVEVMGTMCVLDPEFVFRDNIADDEQSVVDSPLFVNQVAASDVVLVNARTDTYRDALSTWHATLWPPKSLVSTEQRGTAVPSRLLDQLASDEHGKLASLATQVDADTYADTHTSYELTRVSAPGGHPRVLIGRTRHAGDGSLTYSIGLVYHREDIFDRTRLAEFMNTVLSTRDEVTRVLRAKAVMRTGTTAWSLAAVSGSASSEGETAEITLDSSAYRRDSRLEILVRQRGGCGDDDDDDDDGRQDETSLPALDMLIEDDSIALAPGDARDALLRHDWTALVASARSCVRL